jgi:hypothetical protein
VFTRIVLTCTTETVRTVVRWKTARTWMTEVDACAGFPDEGAAPKSGAPWRGGSSGPGSRLGAATETAGVEGGVGGTGRTGGGSGAAGGGTGGCCGAAPGRVCAAACAAAAIPVAIEVTSVLVVCVTAPESPGLATRTEIAMLQATHTVVPVTVVSGGAASGQSQCQFQTIVTAPAVGSGVGGGSGGPSQFQYQFHTRVCDGAAVGAGVDD